MSVAMRSLEATKFESMNGALDVFQKISFPLAPTEFTRTVFFESAFDVCLKLVNKTTMSEPHFFWSGLDEALIRPSDYQNYLYSADSELVSIEEDEVIFRDFCLRAQTQLRKYYDLVDGWDGGDAPAPSVKSLYDAELFLQLVSANVDSCPEISCVLDHEGIPSYVVDNNESYLSLSFYGDYYVTMYSKKRASGKIEAYEFNMGDARELAKTLEFVDSF
ncbi:hypothetical protein [Pseudomonas sp. W5-36]|uniref:hypothetical protein n=1 Tax=Pseudomonas sp. W5-36 TaxID=3097455 RepID=UPI0039795F85